MKGRLELERQTQRQSQWTCQQCHQPAHQTTRQPPPVPLVPLAPPVPRVPVPVRGLLVSPHAVPPLRQSVCAPFLQFCRAAARGDRLRQSLQPAVQVVAA